MSNDISTMYTKEQNQKSGRRGWVGWKDNKEQNISPADYGNYILQHRKRGKKR